MNQHWCLTQLYWGSERTGLGGTNPYLSPRIPTIIWLRDTSERQSSVARTDSSSVTPQRSSTSCTWRQCAAARRRSSGNTIRTKRSRSACMSLNVEEMNTRTLRHLKTEGGVNGCKKVWERQGKCRKRMCLCYLNWGVTGICTTGFMVSATSAPPGGGILYSLSMFSTWSMSRHDPRSATNLVKQQD